MLEAKDRIDKLASIELKGALILPSIACRMNLPCTVVRKEEKAYGATGRIASFPSFGLTVHANFHRTRKIDLDKLTNPLSCVVTEASKVTSRVNHNVHAVLCQKLSKVDERCINCVAFFQRVGWLRSQNFAESVHRQQLSVDTLLIEKLQQSFGHDGLAAPR
jgi:hypothetical protein